MFTRHRPPWRDREFTGPAGGPRVVVENADGAAAWAQAAALRRAGYQTAVCEGPDPERHVTCNLLEEHSCPLASSADAVLCDVRWQAGGAEVLDQLLALRAGQGVLRSTMIPGSEDEPHELPGVTRVAYPMRRSELLDAVSTALDA